MIWLTIATAECSATWNCVIFLCTKRWTCAAPLNNFNFRRLYLPLSLYFFLCLVNVWCYLVWCKFLIILWKTLWSSKKKKLGSKKTSPIPMRFQSHKMCHFNFSNAYTFRRWQPFMRKEFGIFWCHTLKLNGIFVVSVFFCILELFDVRNKLAICWMDDTNHRHWNNNKKTNRQFVSAEASTRNFRSSNQSE